MTWRRFARSLHRDLGYLFSGATIIYALSGLALNHLRDWNPDYVVKRWSVSVDASSVPVTLSRQDATAFLKTAGVHSRVKTVYEEAPGRFKVFYENGSAVFVRDSAQIEFEELRRRPVLHAFNRLHRNPGRWWTWFADVFCAGLLVVAVTGLLILPGHHGITRRGGWLTAVGIAVPALLALLNL